MIGCGHKIRGQFLLSQAGVLKDDDSLDELLANIYKERGRLEIE